MKLMLLIAALYLGAIVFMADSPLHELHFSNAKVVVKRGPRGPRGHTGPMGEQGNPGLPGVQGPVGPVKISGMETSSEQVTVQPNDTQTVSAHCLHNWNFISGGFRSYLTGDATKPATDLNVTSDYGVNFQWSVTGTNHGTDPVELRAVVYCVPIGDAPIG